MNLKMIDDRTLELQLRDLVNKERKLLHVILEHIKEVETRRLYLARACSSMYEYLTTVLGYSGSAAMRRLEAARLLKELPMIAEKIENGSLNLSQIGELARAVKEKEKSQGAKISACEKHDLVQMISYKSTRETQHELTRALDIDLLEPEKTQTQKDESVQLTVTLSKEQFARLQQCRDAAAHLLVQQSDLNWAAVIEHVSGFYLQNKRREHAKTAAVTTASETACVTASTSDSSRQLEATKVLGKTSAQDKRENPKTLTQKRKLEILDRDLHCQYRDPQTGYRCGSTFLLQIDHKRPLWAGAADHSKENLQVLCAAHNQFKYKKQARIKN
jgi:hypothetical protein